MWNVFQNNIRDITDSLIEHCEDRKLDENSNVQVSDEKIVGIVNDLFGAGECWENQMISCRWRLDDTELSVSVFRQVSTPSARLCPGLSSI